MPSTYRRCSNGVRQQRDRHRFAHTWLAPFLCGAVTVGHEQRRSSSHPMGKVCRKVEAGRPSRARMDGARTATRLQTELGSFITSPKSDHITSIKILLDPASSLAEILASLRTRPATAGRLLRPHHISIKILLDPAFKFSRDPCIIAHTPSYCWAFTESSLP